MQPDVNSILKDFSRPLLNANQDTGACPLEEVANVQQTTAPVWVLSVRHVLGVATHFQPLVIARGGFPPEHRTQHA